MRPDPGQDGGEESEQQRQLLSAGEKRDQRAMRMSSLNVTNGHIPGHQDTRAPPCMCT